MNRNIPPALLVLAVLAPGTVLADTAQAPRAKAPFAKSMKAEVPAAPEPAVEASGRIELVTPQPRFKPKEFGDHTWGNESLSAPRPFGRTTIAPFPVPFDTSRAAAGRMQRLNVPKAGETTIAPIPPPAGVEGGVYFGPAPPGGAIVVPMPRTTPPRTNPGVPGLLHSTAPEYPEAARKAGVQGTVWVQIHVLEDGSVGEAAVIRSIPLLDEAALKAVKQWKYAPPTFQGKPTTTWLTVPVKFTLH